MFNFAEENLKVQSFVFPSSPMVGQRVSTMCATVTAGDKMEFRWSKNGVDMTSSNRIQIMTFPQISTLIIDPLTEEDSGNYTCSVFSRGISDSYTASLNVLSKYILQQNIIILILENNIKINELLYRKRLIQKNNVIRYQVLQFARILIYQMNCASEKDSETGFYYLRKILF